MASYTRYESQTDTWREYGHTMIPVFGKNGKFVGSAYAASAPDNKRGVRPAVGDPVQCWNGEVHYVTWVRAHQRRWRIKTEDGVMRTVVEFPTSFLWSQVG